MISSQYLPSPSSKLTPSCTRWLATTAEAVAVAGEAVVDVVDIVAEAAVVVVAVSSELSLI